MSTLENSEKKVLSFMEQVQNEIAMQKENADFLNSTDYKLTLLDKCENDGKAICLDSILRKIYKDAIPLNDDYKVAYNTDIDNNFDTFIQKKCPKGIEFYVKEGLKKNSPFAKKVLEAVNELVNDEIRDKGMNIEKLNPNDLVFACDDDTTKKLDIIGKDLGTPELSQVIQDNVRNTAISEINRAKEEKEKLKTLENELANDVKTDSNEAVESALEFRDMNSKDYVPSLFEAVMINKLNNLQSKFESGELQSVYLYDTLNEYRSNNVLEGTEDTIDFATPEELAFIEAVEEYTAISVMKALKLESYTYNDIKELAQEYAQN